MGGMTKYLLSPRGEVRVRGGATETLLDQIARLGLLPAPMLRTGPLPLPEGRGSRPALCRHLVEEAGDRLQALVGGDEAEIGALGDRRGGFRRELPGET